MLRKSDAQRRTGGMGRRGFYVRARGFGAGAGAPAPNWGLMGWGVSIRRAPGGCLLGDLGRLLIGGGIRRARHALRRLGGGRFGASARFIPSAVFQLDFLGGMSGRVAGRTFGKACWPGCLLLGVSK